MMKAKLNRIRTKIILKIPLLGSYILSKRKGQCFKCGFCCGGCVYLKKKIDFSGKEIKICFIYNKRHLNKECYMQFPLDKKDQIISIGEKAKECGYLWK